MIKNLGSHRLPPALMQAVSTEAAETITDRNRATPKRAKGSSPQYAEKTAIRNATLDELDKKIKQMQKNPVNYIIKQPLMLVRLL